MNILNSLSNTKVVAAIFVIALILNLVLRIVPVNYWTYLDFKIDSEEFACLQEVCIRTPDDTAMLKRAMRMDNELYYRIYYLVDGALLSISIDTWAPAPDRFGVTLLDDGIIEFGDSKFRRYASRVGVEYPISSRIYLVNEEMKIVFSLSDQELLLPRTQEILASLEITRENSPSIVSDSGL